MTDLRHFGNWTPPKVDQIVFKALPNAALWVGVAASVLAVAALGLVRRRGSGQQA